MMDKFPLTWQGRPVGALLLEQEALYTWFTVRCRLPAPKGINSKKTLWCAWVIGESGELRLGVLEPCGDEANIRRKFSRRQTAVLGSVIHGELRPLEQDRTANASHTSPNTATSLNDSRNISQASDSTAHASHANDIANSNKEKTASRTDHLTASQVISWNTVSQPERLFRSAWLKKRLQGMQHVLSRSDPEQKRRWIALPYAADTPFPLVTLFCFARPETISGRACVVYCFDANEQPVFDT